MNSTWLNDYRRNKYHSQSGEDGIIEKILEFIPDKDQWCVEFGAWDGKLLSVTRFFREQGYNAVLIEGDSKKFEELKITCEKEGNSIPLNYFVETRGQNSLDAILEKTPIPTDFDLLVIDIDGNDYNVWKNLERYKPKVVCVECNQSFPDDVIFIQSENESYQGSSMQAMVDLAKEKGYELVATLSGNTFFVQKKYFPLFNIQDNSLRSLRNWYGSIMYVSQTYKGEIFTYGENKLIWSNYTLINLEMKQFAQLCRKLIEIRGVKKYLYLFLTFLRNKLIGL